MFRKCHKNVKNDWALVYRLIFVFHPQVIHFMFFSKQTNKHPSDWATQECVLTLWRRSVTLSSRFLKSREHWAQPLSPALSGSAEVALGQRVRSWSCNSSGSSSGSRALLDGSARQHRQTTVSTAERHGWWCVCVRVWERLTQSKCVHPLELCSTCRSVMCLCVCCLCVSTVQPHWFICILGGIPSSSCPPLLLSSSPAERKLTRYFLLRMNTNKQTWEVTLLLSYLERKYFLSRRQSVV